MYTSRNAPLYYQPEDHTADGQSAFDEEPIQQVTLEPSDVESATIFTVYNTMHGDEQSNERNAEQENDWIVPKRQSYQATKQQTRRCSDRMLNIICLQVCITIQITAFVISVFLAVRANRAAHSSQVTCQVTFAKYQKYILSDNTTYTCLEEQCCAASFDPQLSANETHSSTLSNISHSSTPSVSMPSVSIPTISTPSVSMCILHGRHFDSNMKYTVYEPYDKYAPLCNTDDGRNISAMIAGMLVALLTGICLMTMVCICVPRLRRAWVSH